MRVYRDNVLVSRQYEPAGAYTSEPLWDGTYSFTFEAVDAVGNVSPRSSAVSVTVDTVAPAAPAARTCCLRTTAESVILTI